MVGKELLDRIEAYVRAHKGINDLKEEDEMAEALGINMFDAREGLKQLEKMGKLRGEVIA